MSRQTRKGTVFKVKPKTRHTPPFTGPVFDEEHRQHHFADIEDWHEKQRLIKLAWKKIHDPQLHWIEDEPESERGTKDKPWTGWMRYRERDNPRGEASRKKLENK